MISTITLNTQPITSVASATQPNKINNITAIATKNDQASISDTAKIVMQVLEDNHYPIDADKIMHLQMSFNNGTYEIQSEKIAAKLLKDAQEL